MNKKLKRIVALALIISAFSAATPIKNFDFMSTKAYASTQLTSLKVSGAGNIDLYKNASYKSSEKIGDKDLINRKTYFGKSTSNSIKITTSDAKYIKIFKENKGYDDGESITLNSGTTALKVRVYNEEVDSSTNLSDEFEEQYMIKIKYTGPGADKDSDDKNDDDKYDDDKYDDKYDNDDDDDEYLDDLELSANGDDIDFDFDDEILSYNIFVKDYIESINIEAEPEEDEYKVIINGSTVDKRSKYRKTINLNTGLNKIEIKVITNTKEKVYTLNVTRGNSGSNSPSIDSPISDAPSTDIPGNDIPGIDNPNINSPSDNPTVSEPNINGPITDSSKYNQWVNVNGGWKYNNAYGTALTNTWFYDRNYGQTYYLKEDGYMATGWIYNSGSWYYLNESGAKQTGWQMLNGTWYYLDSTGKMKTGWFKDIDENWYYFKSSGAMVKDTTVDGYKLGLNGALIRG